MPSREFFRMWQAHVDSLLQHDIQRPWEFSLVDVRLQYIELLKLDGTVEVEFINIDQDDVFLAVPCDFLPKDITWKVNNLGWVRVPSKLNSEAHRIELSNEWYSGLRSSLSPSIRTVLQYKLFIQRFLRLFIVPVPGEDYMRVIVTSNLPEVLNTLQRDPSGVGARLLARCLIAKTPGEFPATLQDQSNGTQETHDSEAYTPSRRPFTNDQLQLQSGTAPGMQLAIQDLVTDTTSPGLTALCSDQVETCCNTWEPPSYASVVDRAASLQQPETPNVRPHASVVRPALELAGHSEQVTLPITTAPTESAPSLEPSVPPSSVVRPTLDPAEPRKQVALPVVKALTEATPVLKPSVSPRSVVRPTLHPTEPTKQHECSALSPFEMQDCLDWRGRTTVVDTPSVDAPVSASLVSGEKAAMPLPVLLRQTSCGNPAVTLDSHLFPHQKRTVSWMLDVEMGMSESLFVPQATIFGNWYAFSHGFEKRVFHDTVDILVPKESKLALGGLLAHPVGAGKTVIAAELIRKTLRECLTLVFVPGHIVNQWKSELRRFVPGINVVSKQSTSSVARTIDFWALVKSNTDAVVVPHDLAPSLVFSNKYPFRVIIDEPQDIILQPNVFSCLLEIGSPCRWLLTATPNPLASIMQLALGFKEDPQCKLAYDSMLSWFVRTRCRRDPPYLCLPVPPLHVHMRPVTLLWQETSVLHSYAMQDDLQTAIRLASFFYFARGQMHCDAAQRVLVGAQSFHSLDDWVESHQKKLTTQLDTARNSLRRVEQSVAVEKAAYFRQQKQRQQQGQNISAATSDTLLGESHDEPAEDRVANLEQLFERGGEPGVSESLLEARKEHKTEVENVQRLLMFLFTISDTVTSDSECLICMNELGSKVVSILPCLHSFCANCVAQLLGSKARALCPFCRASILRREVCTFVCEDRSAHALLKTYQEMRAKYGSKISHVIQEIDRILRKFPNDKILVFGQWHSLLREMTKAMPKDFNHCFLDGPMSRRCEIIEQFRTRSDCRVMLLSSESQSSGIILCSQYACMCTCSSSLKTSLPYIN